MKVNNQTGQKPKLLFVRQKRIKTSADFQNRVEDEIIRTLSLHCLISIIEEDFDYGEVCDRINPDFIIIESPGGNRPIPLNITNTNARPDIPKSALYTQDPHDTSRVSFLRLLDQLSIENFFSFGTASIRHAPEFEGRSYIIPLYFDNTIFQDYQLEKIIPVSVFGALMAPQFYHWRAQTVQLLHNEIPTLLYTHPGYESPVPTHRYPILGSSYAQMINRSHFSLSDPTRLDYMVRKHFEIPAAGSILISEDTPELAYHGFKDMENCILGSGNSLIEKIATVAANPELYASIKQSGYDHVHNRFTAEKWTYFVDWYQCIKSLKPGESIQQNGIFGDFSPILKTQTNFPAVSLTEDIHESVFTNKIKTARQYIISNHDLPAAEKILLEILNWGSQHICEPRLLLGIVAMLKGNLNDAKAILLSPYQIRLNRESTTHLDPEELAWLNLLSFMTQDNQLIAQIHNEQVCARHISIRRVNWIKKKIIAQENFENPPEEIITPMESDQISTHWLGRLAFTEWLELTTNIFRANQMLPMPSENVS